jgi:hypothetical protein
MTYAFFYTYIGHYCRYVTHTCVLDRSHHLVPTAYNRGQQQLNYIYIYFRWVSVWVPLRTSLYCTYVRACTCAPYTCTYVLASGMTTYKVSGTSAFMYSVHLYRGKPAHMHVHNTRKVPEWGDNNSIYNHERQIRRTPIVSDRTCSLARDMSWWYDGTPIVFVLCFGILGS